MAKKSKDVSKAVAKIDPSAIASIFAKGMMAPSKKKDIVRAAAPGLAQFSAPPGKGGRSALPPSTPLRPALARAKGKGLDVGSVLHEAAKIAQQPAIVTAAQALGKGPKEIRGKKTQKAGWSLGGLLYTKPFTDLAYTAEGLGPGLVYSGEQLYKTRGKYAGTMGKQFLQSLEESIKHPIRQYNRPGGSTELAGNWLLPVGFGAGTVARGVEAGATASALRAGEITAGQALRRTGRTLIRPQPMKRTLTVGGVKVHPPAFKSALGGYTQKAADRAIQYMLDNPHNLISRAMAHNNPIFGGISTIASALSPEHYFGRTLRYQKGMLEEARLGRSTYRLGPDVGPTAPARVLGTITRKDIAAIGKGKRATRMTRAEQQAMLPKEFDHISSSRGYTAQEYHHDLWNAGTKGDKWTAMSHALEDGELMAMKEPPNTFDLNPEKWNNEAKVSGYFQKMFMHPKDFKKVRESPEKYRFLPTNLVKGAAPYGVQIENGVVKVSDRVRVLDSLDKLTQVIRSGRFIHPGYAQNSIQNRALHISQAGPWAFRNAYWYHHRFPEIVSKYGREDVAGGLEELSGAGRAQAVAGEITGDRSIFGRLRASGEKFWHNVDDRAVRMQMLYHELAHAGYNKNKDIIDLWDRYMAGDPEAARDLTPTAWGGRREAVDYGEMTPTERKYLKKLFIAYGWARGASTYSARFPFQHPVQAHIAQEIGQEGHHKVDEFFKNAGGMIPDWLEGIAPIGRNKTSPWAAETSWLVPQATPAEYIKAIAGRDPSLVSELGPGPLLALEAVTGRTKYGQQLHGAQYITDPLKEAAYRFRPLGAAQPLWERKPTSTIIGGPKTAAMRFLGIPAEQIRDVQHTADVGRQLYRQGLSHHDQIDFDRRYAFEQLPNQVRQIQRKGVRIDDHLLSQVKGDIDAIHDLKQFQLAHSGDYGSFKKLPPIKQVEVNIDYARKYHGMSDQMANSYKAYADEMTSDADLRGLASDIISNYAVGDTLSMWKSILKETAPPKLTKPSKY